MSASPARQETAATDGPPRTEPGPDRPLLALLVLGGALLGVFGLMFTPLHLGTVPLPLGAAGSALLLPWLVLEAAEVDRRPSRAGAPLAAWVVVVLGLGLGGPGGDVLLPATWQSLALVVGGIGAGLLALRVVLNREHGGTR